MHDQVSIKVADTLAKVRTGPHWKTESCQPDFRRGQKKGARMGRLGSVFSEQGQLRKRCGVGVKDQKTGVSLTCQQEQLE